jgi:uncharacterized phage-associated protein
MNNLITIETVANWFLSKESMTHKKLQKVCYYAVAWGWALMKRPIVTNHQFEAWVHGPVSPVLYAEFKSSGWNTISKTSEPDGIPNDTSELLESVWVTYGAKGGDELEALSHSEDPWKIARAGLSLTERGSRTISPEDMSNYYSSIYTGDA